MIATRIISSDKEAYNDRLIIKFNRHRIVLPNKTSKRMYLGKRRYRELINSSEISEVELKNTEEYLYYLPKKIKENIIFPEPIKIQPIKKQAVIEESKKTKSFLQSLFGL